LYEARSKERSRCVFDDFPSNGQRSNSEEKKQEEEYPTENRASSTSSPDNDDDDDEDSLAYLHDVDSAAEDEMPQVGSKRKGRSIVKPPKKRQKRRCNNDDSDAESFDVTSDESSTSDSEEEKRSVRSTARRPVSSSTTSKIRFSTRAKLLLQHEAERYLIEVFREAEKSRIYFNKSEAITPIAFRTGHRILHAKQRALFKKAVEDATNNFTQTNETFVVKHPFAPQCEACHEDVLLKLVPVQSLVDLIRQYTGDSAMWDGYALPIETACKNPEHRSRYAQINRKRIDAYTTFWNGCVGARQVEETVQ
jgi:hypothetical protein